MILDLDMPVATLGQTLALVPGLSSGTLQNWIARDILGDEKAQRGEKNAKLKWSARRIVMLKLLVGLRDFGIEPSRGVVLARRLMTEIEEFQKAFSAEFSDALGVDKYIFRAADAVKYRCVYIYPNGDGTFRAEIASSVLGTTERLANFSLSFLCLPLDLIIADTLNSVSLIVSGIDRDAKAEG